MQSGRCFYLKKREAICFCKGIIAIRCRDGSLKLFSTRIPETPITNLLFCRGDRKKVFFQDVALDDQWKQVFVYFFDDEGALFLCAGKYYIDFYGPIFNVVPSSGYFALRQQVLNIAAIFDEKVLEEIERLEEHFGAPSTDVDLLDEGWGGKNG